jgi:hypothetical protein
MLQTPVAESFSTTSRSSARTGWGSIPWTRCNWRSPSTSTTASKPTDAEAAKGVLQSVATHGRRRGGEIGLKEIRANSRAIDRTRSPQALRMRQAVGVPSTDDFCRNAVPAEACCHSAGPRLANGGGDGGWPAVSDQ